MDYLYQFHTDIGLKKNTNQDSLCIKKARTENGAVMMAVMCDGMGGLKKGEVASASVVERFSKWFETELPGVVGRPDVIDEVQYAWNRMIKQLNNDIADYGRGLSINLGSTLTVLLLLENGSYIIGHVGDSRAYCIDSISLRQLTTDHTVVANDVRMGRITPEQAKTDPRRNVLLQCIGASRFVEPEFVTGKASEGQCYMLCSDGFRHFISEDEILRELSPGKILNRDMIKDILVSLIELNKERGERDNISSILIKTV